MRKIRIIEHISLDGVIQVPSGPNEDPGYVYGPLRTGTFGDRAA